MTAVAMAESCRNTGAQSLLDFDALAEVQSVTPSAVKLEYPRQYYNNTPPSPLCQAMIQTVTREEAEAWLKEHAQWVLCERLIQLRRYAMALDLIGFEQPPIQLHMAPALKSVLPKHLRCKGPGCGAWSLEYDVWRFRSPVPGVSLGTFCRFVYLHRGGLAGRQGSAKDALERILDPDRYGVERVRAEVALFALQGVSQ